MITHAPVPVRLDGVEHQFNGLGSLARLAFAGCDLEPWRAGLVDRIARNQNDANALMDLSIVLQLMGQREAGLSVQARALKIQQLYTLPATEKPTGTRLLAILSPGDLAQNNALEFLVEKSDILLHLLYVAPDGPLPRALPDHDLAMVAVCESDPNRPLLQHIEQLLQTWPRPVLCAPGKIARLSRDGAYDLLRSVPGTIMPSTARVDRPTLESVGRSEQPLSAAIHNCTYPIIVRPVDSQKGHGLRRIDNPEAIASYLTTTAGDAFYLAEFIDYCSPDGKFRKYRVVLIDGHPYACHMAISDQWVVHYLSAGMIESAEKRAEEARFFATFDDDFARRHRHALSTLAQRLELEYVGIDCAETAGGELLIFEVDSGMTVHAMDSVEIFPYKQPQMRRVFRAFRQMLIDKQKGRPAGPEGSVTL